MEDVIIDRSAIEVNCIAEIEIFLASGYPLLLGYYALTTPQST
ncbi:hypothetical protein T08_14010 [Trichinella sp. T8]|nr:hypothetical protein T08_14010 [Trichinella sp. T8]